MATPNNGLITETNAQYYAGSQTFEAPIVSTKLITTFDTDLTFGNYNPNTDTYNLNNFRLYVSPNGLANQYQEYVNAYTVENNVITLATIPPLGTESFVVQLLSQLEVRTAIEMLLELQWKITTVVTLTLLWKML